MKTLNCSCSDLFEIIRLDKRGNLADSLDELENGNWVKLCKCPSCKQLWSVDERDKYKSQFAIKIWTREGWREFNTTPARKRFLVRSRGGTIDAKCIWAGCKGKQVRGTVFCVDHLYASGARE